MVEIHLNGSIVLDMFQLIRKPANHCTLSLKCFVSSISNENVNLNVCSCYCYRLRKYHDRPCLPDLVLNLVFLLYFCLWLRPMQDFLTNAMKNI